MFYTNGSKGEGSLGPTNSAAFCQIGRNGKVIKANALNLGPNVEVADAEVIGVYEAIITAALKALKIFLFVDS